MESRCVEVRPDDIARRVDSKSTRLGCARDIEGRHLAPGDEKSMEMAGRVAAKTDDLSGRADRSQRGV
jgi:hypothetical protein